MRFGVGGRLLGVRVGVSNRGFGGGVGPFSVGVSRRRRRKRRRSQAVRVTSAVRSPRHQYSALYWFSLIIFCPPLGILLFCLWNPAQVARFCRWVRDLVVQYPKATALAVIAIGIGVAIGNTVNGKYPQALWGALLIAVSLGVLSWLLLKERGAEAGDQGHRGVSAVGDVPRFPWARDRGL